MTANEFLAHVFAAADELAFRLAGTPRDSQEEWLEGFAFRVRKQWGEVLDAHISHEDLDAITADMVGRVKAKRDYLERFGAGSA